jgi:fumarate hydratase, class II
MRKEKDSLGYVEIAEDKYWGAQTQRSLENFPIGKEKMPKEIISAYAFIKKAAAQVNAEMGMLPKEKAEYIGLVCDEILEGKLDDNFPLVIWQTGSGTQTNMNLNEVIANRAHVLMGGKITDSQKMIHPNDDVNMSQSSNDSFPTAMHLAAVKLLQTKTLVDLKFLLKSLQEKAKSFEGIIKSGRTHLMDATPLSLSSEFGGYASQLKYGIREIENCLPRLQEIALGGTAVGTGLNAPKNFDIKVAERISEISGFHFITADDKYEAISAHDALLSASSALKNTAVSLKQIANNIRLLASGPRCGIGELNIPANEPGSSIMPGKVNPTQCEALIMVAAQVIGNDLAISIGGMGGQFQLNTCKPLIIRNFLQSANILGDAAKSFALRCVSGITANKENIQKHLENSLMLVTALNPHIGYENAAKIAQSAHQNNISLRQAAIESGILTAEDFDRWMKMEEIG